MAFILTCRCSFQYHVHLNGRKFCFVRTYGVYLNQYVSVPHPVHLKRWNYAIIRKHTNHVWHCLPFHRCMIGICPHVIIIFHPYPVGKGCTLSFIHLPGWLTHTKAKNGLGDAILGLHVYIPLYRTSAVRPFNIYIGYTT